MAAWSTRSAVTFLLTVAAGTIDISQYVLRRGGETVASRGRQTELVRFEPGRLSFGLDNSSGQFTPGSSSATYALTLGARIQLIETLGYRSFSLFDGFLEIPDTVEQITGADNIIAVNAVDRKQLLDNGRTFISTLTEYVAYAGRSTLIAHWHMADPSGSGRCESLAAAQGPLLQEANYFGGAPWPANPLLQFGSVQGPPGDDASYPRWTVTGDGVTSLTSGRLAQRELSGVTITSTYLVLSMWVLIGSLAGANQSIVLRDNAFVQNIILDYAVVGGPTVWRATVSTSGGTTTINGAGVNPGHWQYISIRVNTSTSGVDLWVDNESDSGTYTGTLSGQFDSVVVDGYSSDTSAAQLQIHRFSTSTAYDRTTHLAQSVQGRTGLAYQRTDERITTILGYASPNTTIPAVLDEGVTFMQRASLAGRKPGQLIDDATDTERGRCFVDGAGILRVHNRIRTHYNV